MELDKHEVRFKKYIRLSKKSAELSRKMREVSYVELKEPYRSGWIVSTVLREDAQRREDAQFMKDILEWFTRPYVTKDIDIVRAARSGSKIVTSKKITKRRWRALRAAKRKRQRDVRLNHRLHGYYDGPKVNDHYDGKLYYEWDIAPKIREINQKEYDALSQRHKNFFEYMTYKSTEYPWSKPMYGHCIPTYYIRTKVEVNWITHEMIEDYELKSQEAFIDDKRVNLGRLGYGHKWRNYSQKYSGGRQRALVRDSVRKFLKGEVEDLPKEKVPRDYND